MACAEEQSSLDSFLTPTNGVQIYSQDHPRQGVITESIIQDLIISCNLPLSLIDKPSFNNFMSLAEGRYCPVSRSTVTRCLSELEADKESKIKSNIQSPAKMPCLFTGYRRKSNKKDDHVSPVRAELICYIQVSSDENEVDCLGMPKSSRGSILWLWECSLFHPPVHQWSGYSQAQ